MILGYSIGYLVGGITGCLRIHCFKHFKLRRINWNKAKKMLLYSIPMIPNSIAWWIISISDRVIISSILGVASNAILAVAHKIPNLCTTLYDVFQTAWVENASEAIKDKDWDEYLKKMLNIMCQFCVSISIIIITTNFFLFDMLFTAEYTMGKYLIPLFAIAVVFNAISQTLGSVFIAEYNSKRQAITMLEAGVMNIVIHLLLIKFIGIYAAAVSTVVSYIFLFCIRYKDIKKKYKIAIDKKTIGLFAFLILCMGISYCSIEVLNFVMLIISIAVCMISNKQALSIILKKLIPQKNYGK